MKAIEHYCPVACGAVYYSVHGGSNGSLWGNPKVNLFSSTFQWCGYYTALGDSNV